MADPELLIDDRAGRDRAATLLLAGALVALPTETVYGLGADARNGQAVASIFEAKGRPAFNPLIIHVASLEEAARLVTFNDTALALAQAFWPGPLTLVLPLRAETGLSPLVSAGLRTLAIRVPAHPAMQGVLQAFGGPIAAPSANPSGQISATTAAHVIDGLGPKIAAVLDAGPTEVGLESTILAPAGDATRLLREGGLPHEAIEPLTGPLVADTTPGTVQAPGQLSSHYAPHTPLHMGGPVPAGSITIGFGSGASDLTLSQSGDLREAAARLFSVLHRADALAKMRNAPLIHIADIPERGLGRAINDRLRRAAAPK